MPETFPEWDSETNSLIDRTYYDILEVAAMLHMSRSAAYERMAADDWPHLQVARRAWFSAEDVGAIVESMRRGTPLSDPGPRSMGSVLPPDPWLTGGDDADQDPGGVR